MNSNTLQILKDKIDWSGYRSTYLYYEKCYTFKIHRLVALAFLPNPNNYPIVLHLDNNKLNCHYSNLKWGTSSENRQQAIDDGLARNPDVRQYYKVYNEETGDFKLCYGIREVKELTQYSRSFDSLYRIGKHGSKLRTGPYAGYKIQRMNLTPAWTYQGVIGYNIGRSQK